MTLFLHTTTATTIGAGTASSSSSISHHSDETLLVAVDAGQSHAPLTSLVLLPADTHHRTSQLCLAQSCTRVQISRPDPAHKNRDPTRPANIPGFLDSTRWLSMIGKKGFIIARCTLSSAYTQVTSSTRKTIRSSYTVAALYQLLPESLNCDDWVPTNMYARNVRDVAAELSLMIRLWSCNKKSLC